MLMKSESFKTGRFWVALLATVVCGGWVQAGEVIPYRYLDGRIGIDFRSNLESNLLNYSEVAGIPDVEQAYWNQMVAVTPDANGYGNYANLDTLYDGNGNYVDGMSVRAYGERESPFAEYPDYDFRFWGQINSGWGMSGNNYKLRYQGFGPSPVIEITGIPYTAYDVVVYYAAGPDGGGMFSAILPMNGNMQTVAEDSSFYVYSCHFSSGTNIWKSVKFDTVAEIDGSQASNYAVFHGNSAKNIKLYFNGTVHRSWNCISAVQIVETPPPATVIFLL